jgi:hypothetical protein
LIALVVVVSQASLANTSLLVTVTFSDTTTATLATVNQQAETIQGGNAGLVKTRAGAWLLDVSFGTKLITNVSVITQGTGVGNRTASLSALIVPQ